MGALFVMKGRQDPGIANADILDWINERKKIGFTYYQLHQYTAAVRSLLKYTGVMLNDYQISKALAAVPKKDRTHPSLQDLRKLRSVLDERGRFVESAMVSGFFVLALLPT